MILIISQFSDKFSPGFRAAQVEKGDHYASARNPWRRSLTDVKMYVESL